MVVTHSLRFHHWCSCVFFRAEPKIRGLWCFGDQQHRRLGSLSLLGFHSHGIPIAGALFHRKILWKKDDLGVPHDFGNLHFVVLFTENAENNCGYYMEELAELAVANRFLCFFYFLDCLTSTVAFYQQRQLDQHDSKPSKPLINGWEKACVADCWGLQLTHWAGGCLEIGQTCGYSPRQKKCLARKVEAFSLYIYYILLHTLYIYIHMHTVLYMCCKLYIFT